MIKTLALEVDGRSDITIDLTAPGSAESLKDKPFAIKEGAKFRMKANFVVQHDVLNGLKYIEVIKRKGIKVGKREEMLVRILKPYPIARHGGRVTKLPRVRMPRTLRISLCMKENVSTQTLSSPEG